MADETDGPRARELERLIERNHAETSSDIAKLDSQVTSQIARLITQLDQYVLSKVYEADEKRREAVDQSRDQRISRLEDHDSKSRFANRAALVVAGVAILGWILSIVRTNLGG